MANLIDTIGVTGGLLILMAFIIVLSIMAYFQRSEPMEKPDEELNEAMRQEAEDANSGD